MSTENTPPITTTPLNKPNMSSTTNSSTSNTESDGHGRRAEARDVFGIGGVAPEVLAVGFAKYSRSQGGVRATLAELNETASAAFHEKWVLGYGDASVADMALVSLALENVSILASKAVEDARLAAYQEKSTRYVPFFSIYTPPALDAAPESAKVIWNETMNQLWSAYDTIRDKLTAYYRVQYPQVEGMSDKLYEARLRARALDVARYVLPTATVTNFGMIASARTLRYTIGKLRAHPLEEVRAIADEMETAARNPAHSPAAAAAAPHLNALKGAGVEMEAIAGVEAALAATAAGAPTLLKHTEAHQYGFKVDAIVRPWASAHIVPSLDTLTPSDNPERVTMIPTSGPEAPTPEQDLVAGLVYPIVADHRCGSYANILKVLSSSVSQESMVELIDQVTAARGRHDVLGRAWEVGAGISFELTMDYGAYRDLQRHRMTTQLNQELSPVHGWETPRDLEEAGAGPVYAAAMQAASDAWKALVPVLGPAATYVLALGFRKRTVFRMNVRELTHIVELRTKTGGHFSYRTAVYDMYKAYAAAHPALAAHMRAVNMDFAADFYKR